MLREMTGRRGRRAAGGATTAPASFPPSIYRRVWGVRRVQAHFEGGVARQPVQGQGRNFRVSLFGCSNLAPNGSAMPFTARSLRRHDSEQFGKLPVGSGLVAVCRGAFCGWRRQRLPRVRSAIPKYALFDRTSLPCKQRANGPLDAGPNGELRVCRSLRNCHALERRASMPQAAAGRSGRARSIKPSPA